MRHAQLGDAVKKTPAPNASTDSSRFGFQNCWIRNKIDYTNMFGILFVLNSFDAVKNAVEEKSKTDVNLSFKFAYKIICSVAISLV